MKDRNHAVDRDLVYGRGALSGAVVLRRVDREHGALAFGAALALAALLHIGLVFYLTRPAPVSKPVPVAPDTTHVRFIDQNRVEQPVDPSYPPVVAPLLPQVGPDQPSNGPAAPPDLSQGRIDANGLDVNPGDLAGQVIVIGDHQKSLNDLLVIPKYQGNGGPPAIGVRGRVLPEAVPWVKVEVKPQAVSIPVPAYPEVVRVAGIEGKTVVEALVDTDGSVAAVRVLVGSGNVLLDAAACEAAQGAKFTPARQRDKPVRVWVSMPFRFSLH